MLLLVLAFAMAWQGFVSGTHLHAPRSGLSVAAQALQLASKRGHQGPAAPDDSSCPLCQSIASSGCYLVTPVAELALVAATSVAAYVASAAWLIPERQPSHAWRSRAPPHSN